jgi:DNA polymerase V
MSEDKPTVHAGFPSPAQDYMNAFISLDKELVRHPAATFFARVVGDSMVDAGVEEGDVLVVDKALEPQEGDMAVCFIDGEFALKFISFVEPMVAGEESAAAPYASRPNRVNGRSSRSARQPIKASKPRASYDILEHKKMWLLPANEKYPPIEVTESNDFTVWGVVTYIIKKACTRL